MEEIRKIDMLLTKNKSGEECLRTSINNIEFEINFSSDDQKNLRNLFLNCFLESKKKPFELKFCKDEEIKNTIIEKVSNDYVNQLNIELCKISEKIKTALDSGE